MTKIKNPVYRSSNPESAYYYGPVDKDLYVNMMRPAILSAVEKFSSGESYELITNQEQENDCSFRISGLNCFVYASISTTFMRTFLGVTLYDKPNRRGSRSYCVAHKPDEVLKLLTINAQIAYYDARFWGMNMALFEGVNYFLKRNYVILTPWAKNRVDVRPADAANMDAQYLYELQVSWLTLLLMTKIYTEIKPMTDLETIILKTAKESVSKSVVSALTEGYDNPMKQLCEKVLNKHKTELSGLIDSEITALISGEEFKNAIKEALTHKLAKTLVSKMGGEIEKRVNELQQNPETRARITVRISELIKEL